MTTETVIENEFWSVSYDPSRRLVRITRTAKQLPSDGRDLDLAGVEKKLAHIDHSRAVVLLDMRAAPLRNDPEFERMNSERNVRTTAFMQRFARGAMLLASAVGKLQVTRLQRERGVGLPPFLDEREALAHLGLALAG